MRRLTRFLLCAALAVGIFAAACGKRKTRVAAPPPSPRARTPPAPPVGSTERGLASWYGKPYDGRPAADGEIYDMEQMVAAHRTLPFQTMVRVRNLTNDKTVDVRIIDRGPFVANRIIDLSHAAARAIDLIGPGVANVQLTIIANTAPAAPIAVSTPAVIVAEDNAQFGVQVGAFRDRANADRMQQQMAAAYGAAKVVIRQGDPPLWRVLAGSEPSPDAAEALATRIRQEQNLSNAFVVRLDPSPTTPN
jgi:rare lipoprotein A